MTATRREEKLQDVSMSVNVATGEQLQKFNIFDAKDVSQLAPGLELTNTTGRNNTTTLRGVTFDPDQGTAPAVQVYYNEIPTDAQTAYTAIYDISQIEVLRGPQGLLRGLSAPAGSITIGTRRPSFDMIEGFMQATATDRAGYNVQGGVSLPFSDTLAIRVAGLVDGNRLNNVTNVNLDKRSRSRTESARVTLGWRPSDAFTAYLTYQYLTADNSQFQQVVGSGNQPVYSPAIFVGFPLKDSSFVSGPALDTSDYGAVGEGIFRNRNDTHLVNLNFDYDLGGSTLSFVGAHQFSKLTIQRDLDPGNSVPNYIASSTVITPYKVDTAELRWATDNQEGLGGGIGVFYTKQTGTTVVDQRSDTFSFPLDPNGLIPGTTIPNLFPVDVHVVVPVYSRTWSFNANLRYKTGPLTIEGGVRYSIRKAIQTTQQTLNLGPFPDFPFPGAPAGYVLTLGPTEIIPTDLQKHVDKPITGGVTVNYAFADTLNAYFAYGHSFRGGSTGVSVPAGISGDLISTGSEKTDSFEIGLKGSLMDRRVNYTVAAFYQKFNGFLTRFTGIQYNCPEENGQCSVTGAPINNAIDSTNGGFDFNYNANAKSKGIEASIDTRFIDTWDLSLSAAYTRARFNNALIPCNDFDGSGVPNQNGTPRITGNGNVSYCRTNGRMAEIPDFSLTANTELRFPTGNYTPFIRALFTYRPGFHSELVNYDYRGRELLNLFVGLRGPDSKWELTGFARNLLNQKRITNISLGNAIIPTSQPLGPAGAIPYDSGYRLVNVMNPREFGATLNFRW
ncbi:TonB-dependent receptor [Sphingobium sp.]|uniref:TonB-dependent receptor n=1 Tax=Sphingobium sp. TaxID=1912891 RepID=UPI002C4ADFBE|nr:TonB-dependent receptor plug domain-containing protein [Sphingobium sp.]HUD90884.1 TonB-dependent receptor plug domain-containing protein [Sphingobium sp.]